MITFTLQEIQALLGAEVKIHTIDEKCHAGIVHLIDPQSNSVVLCKNVDAGDSVLDMKIITNHSIKSLQVLKNDCSMESMNVKECYNLTAEQLEEKRCKIKRWLTTNLISVQEQGNILKIDDQLIIEPPYGPNECLCGNTIILDRIRSILDHMPNTF